MNQMMSLEFMITYDWRSSDLLTALIYWENSLNSTFILLTSCQVSSSWTINCSLKMIEIAFWICILYHQSKSSIKQLWLHFFHFFIKCMQFMTMILFRRCVYATLHVIWLKSLLYIFSLINHIDSLHIQALSLKLLSSYFRFSSSLRTLYVLLFRF